MNEQLKGCYNHGEIAYKEPPTSMKRTCGDEVQSHSHLKAAEEMADYFIRNHSPKEFVEAIDFVRKKVQGHWAQKIEEANIAVRDMQATAEVLFK